MRAPSLQGLAPSIHHINVTNSNSPMAIPSFQRTYLKMKKKIVTRKSGGFSEYWHYLFSMLSYLFES